MSATAKASCIVRPPFKDRPRASGTERSAAAPRRAMAGLAGNPLRTRETDAIETPARLATVTTVGRRAARLRVNVFMPRPERYAGARREATGSGVGGGDG